MGVYNPLAKMPRTCDSCDNWHREHCDLRHDKFMEERHPDCPLVEVETPHGRLVDADVTLRSEQPSNVTDDQWAQTTLARCIINAPTIIEAEGKDDD